MAKIKQGIKLKNVAKNKKAKYTIKSGKSIVQTAKNGKITTKYTYANTIYVKKKYSYK